MINFQSRKIPGIRYWYPGVAGLRKAAGYTWIAVPCSEYDSW